MSGIRSDVPSLAPGQRALRSEPCSRLAGAAVRSTLTRAPVQDPPGLGAVPGRRHQDDLEHRPLLKDPETGMVALGRPAELHQPRSSYRAAHGVTPSTGAHRRTGGPVSRAGEPVSSSASGVDGGTEPYPDEERSDCPSRTRRSRSSYGATRSDAGRHPRSWQSPAGGGPCGVHGCGRRAYRWRGASPGRSRYDRPRRDASARQVCRSGGCRDRPDAGPQRESPAVGAAARRPAPAAGPRRVPHRLPRRAGAGRRVRGQPAHGARGRPAAARGGDRGGRPRAHPAAGRADRDRAAAR